MGEGKQPNPLLLEVSPGIQTPTLLEKIHPVEADLALNTQLFYLDETPPHFAECMNFS